VKLSTASTSTIIALKNTVFKSDCDLMPPTKKLLLADFLLLFDLLVVLLIFAFALDLLFAFVAMATLLIIILI